MVYFYYWKKKQLVWCCRLKWFTLQIMPIIFPGNRYWFANYIKSRSNIDNNFLNTTSNVSIRNIYKFNASVVKTSIKKHTWMLFESWYPASFQLTLSLSLFHFFSLLLDSRNGSDFLVPYQKKNMFFHLIAFDIGCVSFIFSFFHSPDHIDRLNHAKRA